MFKLVAGAALVAAVAIGVYMYARLDDEIRRHVEGLLADRYPQFDVSVGGARIVEGRGIAIYDLALADPADAGRDAALVHVDELMLVCDVDLPTLVQGTPPVRRVEVRSPHLALRRDDRGRWNFLSLVPLKPCGGEIPQIIVREGVVSIADSAAKPPLVLREIQLTISPAAPPGGPPAAVHAAARPADAPAAPLPWPTLEAEGTLGGPLVKRAALHARVDGPSRRCSATLDLAGVQIGPAIMEWAHAHLPPVLRDTAVAAAVDGQARVEWACGAGGAPQASATLAVRDGRIEDPRLPQAITELAGTIELDNNRLHLEQMHGKCGTAAVAINLNRAGWGETAPLALAGRLENQPLDAALYNALAATSRRGMGFDARFARTLLENWDRFSPTGVVDGTLEATFDGARWRPAASLIGRQLTFQSDQFPYRVVDGAGAIDFHPAAGAEPPRLTVNIVAQGGGQPLAIVGTVVDPKPQAAGWIEITGRDVEIDKNMIAALAARQPKAHEVIASLNPSGRFNVRWRIERPEPGALPRTTMDMELVDVRINYNRFPYPVRRIRGLVRGEGNQWAFQNLESAGRPTIRCDGALRPAPEGNELVLRLTADGAPLNEELFDALPPPVQRAWQQLQPRGEFDLVTDVYYRTGQGPPNIRAAIRPRPGSAQIRPTFFPYLMEQLSGTITYQDGDISLVDLAARHDRTAIRTNGAGYFGPDGGWNLQLTGLTVDRLTPAQDLLAALQVQAKPLWKVIDRLRPTGNFWLSGGTLAFRKPASEIAPLETEWDVQIDCHQSDLQCGVALENIHGAVRLRGRNDGVRFYTTGEMALESVAFQGVQFTDVRGPLWVDESRCLLGRLAASQSQQPERRLTAKVYDGSAAADAWVKFDILPSYSVQARLVGADLNRVVVERMGGQQQFGGKLDAELNLNGSGYKVESLVGEGGVHIRDADIGQLSLLVSLLKVLKRGAVDTSAFNQVEVAYQLQGRHIYLKQIDFLGDVVNLYGVGETDFDKQVKLVFSPSVGRNEFYFPMIKNLVGHANSQIMKMYVTGPIDNPQVTREAFPGIAQMLDQIRADLNDPTGVGTRQALRAGADAPPAAQ